MGKIIKNFTWWMGVICFVLIAKLYTNVYTGQIEYPKYLYEDLPVGKQEIKIFSDDQPIGYHEVKIPYETFPLIYKNDVNMDYKFINDYKDNSALLNTFRVIRLITTLS